MFSCVPHWCVMTDSSVSSREPEDEENNNNTNSGGSLKGGRHKRHTINGIIGGTLASALASSTSGSGAGVLRKTSVSVKRPLDAVLPCQEIQYLDISYQKVGTVMVRLPTTWPMMVTNMKATFFKLADSFTLVCHIFLNQVIYRYIS